MLAYAKQRSPKIAFLLADARKFSLPGLVDAAISTFDSLNHIMNSDDLSRVFGNVYACLHPGASFVFDLNTEDAYKEFWARTSTSISAKAVSIARGSYDGLQKIAHCDVTLFRSSANTWQRSDFRLTQRFYPQTLVLQTLQSAGFEARVCDGAADLNMQGNVGVGRYFFVATKPAAGRA